MLLYFVVIKCFYLTDNTFCVTVVIVDINRCHLADSTDSQFVDNIFCYFVTDDCCHNVNIMCCHLADMGCYLW